MPREQNFYYQGDPTQQIGFDLVRAMLGDPAMAAQQQKQQAEMAEREARTRLLNGQADGVGIHNTASLSLPELFAQMAPKPVPMAPPPQPIPTLDSPDFLAGAGPTPMAPPPVDPMAQFSDNLAALIAAMSQMQGDKVNPSDNIRTLAAFMGGDEMARRGMIGAGDTPGKEFALTSGCADEIAQQGYDAEASKALGVATINNRDDIPVANIQAGASRDVATINHSNDIPVATIKADATRDVAGIKATGAAPGFDAIQRAIPGATMTSRRRSAEHNRAVGGVDDSMHLGRPGIQAYDTPAQPGMTVQEAARRIEAANPGVRVIEAIDERGRVGPNGKALGGWHFALANVGGGKAGGKVAAPKTPRAISLSRQTEIGTLMTTRLKELKGVQVSDPDLRGRLIARAVTFYQQSGNMQEAVDKAIRNVATADQIKASKPAEKGMFDGWGKPKPKAASAKAAPIRVKSPAEAMKLKPGTRYMTHDGREMIR